MAPTTELWAGDLGQRAGEHLDYVAIHLMGQRPIRKDTVLRGLRYQEAPEQAWQELVELSDNVEKKVPPWSRSSRPAIEAGDRGHGGTPEPAAAQRQPDPHGVALRRLPCAVDEHLPAARGQGEDRHRGGLLRDAMDRQRGDDAGTPGVSYLTPVGSAMRLFRRHNGKQGVAVRSAPANLDIAASRSGNKLFLHVVNTDYSDRRRSAWRSTA